MAAGLSRTAGPVNDSRLPRRNQSHLWLSKFVVRFALQTNSVPQFQIQQTPDPVVVVTVLCAMFGEQTLNRFAAEVSAIETARFEQHLSDVLQTWSGEPATPWCWEAEFWPVDN